MSDPIAILAYSGGLDTTFCLRWLQQERGFRVVTVTVDTGGFTPAELAEIEARALELGAIEHRRIDGRTEVFERFLVPLIGGNVLRGRRYPLSVAAERVVQVEQAARVAEELGAAAVAHGCTGAGNDQFRFQAGLQTLLPAMPILAPVQDLGWSRQQEVDYLAAAGVELPEKTSTYSVNAGLWGTTIGGGETSTLR